MINDKIDNHSTPIDGADQSMARKHNSSIILNALRLDECLSRASLARKFSLTRSSVSRIVDELVEQKLVREVDLSQGKKGRPGMLLELDPKGGSAIGIEIGVNFISILLTDFKAKVIWRKRESLPDDASSNDYLLKAELLARHAFDLAGQLNLRKMGIGIGVWGLVDQKKGVIWFAPNLKWNEIPLKEIWEDKFQVPIYIENDANASALGEYYFGAGRDIENFLYMSLDIGVGGGIISNGKLFRGSSGFAGEIGHMLIDPQGDLCSCGKVGCLQALVGRRAIIKRYQSKSGQGEFSLEEIIQKAREGDRDAKAIIEWVAEALGVGIGNLVNIFNPQRVILGWSLGQAYELLLPTLQKSIEKNSLPVSYGRMDIVPYANGADDCVLGCVALVLDEIIRERISY